MATQGAIGLPSQGVAGVTGNVDTPTEWETLADVWELTGLDASEVEQWVDAGVVSPTIRGLFVDRGVTVEDAAMVRAILTSTPLPPLQDGIAVIALLKALAVGGVLVSDQLLSSVSNAFFTELSDGRVGLTLLP